MTTGFAGVDSFTYRMHDGTQYSNIATATIQVNNAAPNAATDMTMTDEDTPVTFTRTMLIANDSDRVTTTWRSPPGRRRPTAPLLMTLFLTH
jgi:hypothetical protein